MSDSERRETSLMMGVAVFLAIVAAVFFSMTMAWRQANQRRARWQELRAQVAAAQQRAQQAPQASVLDRLAAQAQSAGRVFIAPDQVPVVRDRVSALADGLGATLAWLPATTPAAPTAVLPGFEECYQAQSLVGTIEAPYQELAIFLARVAALEDPVVGVRSCAVTPAAGLRRGGSGARPRLKARVVLETYVWMPDARPKGVAPPAAPVTPPDDRAPAAWGRDPFDPRYLPTGRVEGVVLNGIVWDAERPTCLLNGAVLEPGGVLGGYTVVTITPDAVILRGESREVVLAVSP